MTSDANNSKEERVLAVYRRTFPYSVPVTVVLVAALISSVIFGSRLEPWTSTVSIALLLSSLIMFPVAVGALAASAYRVHVTENRMFKVGRLPWKPDSSAFIMQDFRNLRHRLPETTKPLILNSNGSWVPAECEVSGIEYERGFDGYFFQGPEDWRAAFQAFARLPRNRLNRLEALKEAEKLFPEATPAQWLLSVWDLNE